MSSRAAIPSVISTTGITACEKPEGEMLISQKFKTEQKSKSDFEN
jgi:hypothetical protein